MDVPQNPDKVSTDQIRFKCKQPCISECFKERKHIFPQYYDGNDRENEWLIDSNITLTCLDESEQFTATSLPISGASNETILQ